MKKLHMFLMLTIVGGVLLAACSKEGMAEEPVPEQENEDEEEIIIEEEDPVAVLVHDRARGPAMGGERSRLAESGHERARR